MNTQNIATPWEFIRAVEKLFNIQFKYDMAASSDNAKAPIFFTEENDSLSIDWPTNDWIWLNPTFKNVGVWAKKCEIEMNKGSSIISIWPLSSDLNMVNTWKYSNVFPIHGRVWPNVRGCMLCEWSSKSNGEVQCLTWDKKNKTLLKE